MDAVRTLPQPGSTGRLSAAFLLRGLPLAARGVERSDPVLRDFLEAERRGMLKRINLFVPVILAVTLLSEIAPLFSPEFPSDPLLSGVEAAIMLAVMIVARRSSSRGVIGAMTILMFVVAAAYVATACVQSGRFKSPHVMGEMVVLAFALSLPFSLLEGAVACVFAMLSWLLVSLLWQAPTAVDLAGIDISVFYLLFMSAVIVGAVYLRRRGAFSRAVGEARLAQANEELRATQSRLVAQARLAGMGTLVAGVAHEIGNPLNAVMGGAAELRERSDDGDTGTRSLTDPQNQRLVRLVETGAERIQDVIDGMRMHLGGGSAEHRTIPLYEGLRTTTGLLSHSLESAGVEIRLELDGEPRVRGVAGQLQQVFTNLMVNAQQATLDGGALVIRGEVVGPRVELRFVDDGEGVPDAIRDSIFVPFFTTKDPGEGTGLGLSISREIVEDHGGHLVLEESDSGATFLVQLPMAEA